MDENRAAMGQQTEDINEVRRVRREKLAALVEAGRDPFEITKYDRTHFASQIVDGFDALEGQRVSVAGRMMSRRVMGKASFAHIQDKHRPDSGLCAHRRRRQGGLRRVQTDGYRRYPRRAQASVFQHQARARSPCARTKVTLLAEVALQPLPEKFHGLRDLGHVAIASAAVDLIVNPEVQRQRSSSAARSCASCAAYLRHPRLSSRSTRPC